MHRGSPCDLSVFMKATKRFTGLRLTKKDRVVLLATATGNTRERLTARVWRRIRTLLLLDEGNSVRGTAEAVGGYPREISRVGKRYLTKGLKHALSEDVRPHPAKKLDSTQESAVVAMACGPAPEGRARWTIRLVAEHAVRKRIVDKIGRETIRILFAHRGLKPWREKMWCVPELTPEYVARMEDVLRVYARPVKASEPVVCLDERPVVLHDDSRPGVAMKPGRVGRKDYEYVRRGTANVFCIVEPLTGRRLTRATRNRTGAAFARTLKRVADRYANARKIHLVMDNLSTHSKTSLVKTFGDAEGVALWKRFRVHFTPKHGSSPPIPAHATPKIKAR